MSDEPTRRPTSILGLMGLLALFLVPGAACAAILWHVLSTLLTGRIPARIDLTAAAAALILLLALLRGLWYCLRRFGLGRA